ncbi:MAG: Lipid A export ATP-binding/permease protein MsbA [uncultured Campylobacterales bacterium]|uniref:Lipid A export ATP-binding/permease protein MsbA n=1 Tax=uncultured Campylobacterales bacterium TaxID=352960 RepID=A0A6S6S726_9BACT|nr:MAG: Lipid A export ATP-binding/permease protein MsbA [uncultured Campylobacterales bacterium]
MILSHKKEFFIANILAVLVALVSLPVPLIIPLLVDEVLLNKPSYIVGFLNQFVSPSLQVPIYYFAVVTGLTIILRILTVIIGVFEIKKFTIIAKNITYKIRKDLLKVVRKISMSEYETLGSTAVSSRFVVDIDTIDRFISTTISKLIISILIFIGVSVILLLIHWQLALFLLFFNPVVLYFSNRVAKNVRGLKTKENKAYEVFSESLSQTLDAMAQVRASNQSKNFFDRLSFLADEIRQSSGEFFWKNEASSRFSFTIFLASFDVFRATSMLLVLYSDLSIGEMFAVFSYLWYMMGPVQEILGIQYAWHSANAALTRINEFLSMKKEVDYEHRKNPFDSVTTTTLSLKNISFSYGDTKILDDINLEVKKGEKIAIVGASGSGKSTVINVILGLYPMKSGDVLFDGVSIKDIGYEVVRDNVATVLQSPFVFNSTIKENLVFNENISDEKIYQALEIAQLKEKVDAMPKGLHTLVGKQGVKLSGGQKQRLAIARMILSNPKLVILDEATSSLDIFTEEKLHHSLEEFLSGVTTIIIAHRKSSIDQADRVFVLEEGRLKEKLDY